MARNSIFCIKKIKKRQKIKLLGVELYICPGVFAPLWTDSIILAKAVKKEVKKGDFVLDLGTGTGIQAIFAAKKGARIIATDINPKALKCAKLNINYHNLKNRISVLKSDLFSKVKSKFDVIIYNPPLRWFKPRDMLERSSLDEN